MSIRRQRLVLTFGRNDPRINIDIGLMSWFSLTFTLNTPNQIVQESMIYFAIDRHCGKGPRSDDQALNQLAPLRSASLTVNALQRSSRGIGQRGSTFGKAESGHEFRFGSVYSEYAVAAGSRVDIGLPKFPAGDLYFLIHMIYTRACAYR